MKRNHIASVLVTLTSVLVGSAGAIGATAAEASAATAGSSAVTAQAAPRVSSHLGNATYERRVQSWINKERTANHLGKVRLNRCADRIAANWSRHLATTSTFEHQDLGPFFNKCGATYAGETLVKGYVTPREAVDAWMKSDGHRHIMLSPSAKRVGVGAHVDGTGAWVVTADFIRR